MAIDDFIYDLFSQHGQKSNEKTKLSFFDMLAQSAPWQYLKNLIDTGSSKWNDIFTKSALISDLSNLGSGKWNDIFTKSSLLTDLSSLGSDKWANIFTLESLQTWLSNLGSSKWADIFKLSDLTDFLDENIIANMFSFDDITEWLQDKFNENFGFAKLKEVYQDLRLSIMNEFVSFFNNFMTEWSS